jgi:AraC-like DNA-binding protein
MISDGFKPRSMFQSTTPTELRGHLQDEGSSSQRVLEEARHNLTRHYLNNPVLELDEAAYLFGYEDANSLVRAFRTWEGVPPRSVA